MDIRFEVEGGSEFVALNTHLSAYAMDDGTPEKEIKMLLEHTEKLDDAGLPWILAGDFNHLPPGDDRKRLGNDPQGGAQFYSEITPVAKLLEKQRSAMDMEEWKRNPALFNTYLPFKKDDNGQPIEALNVSDRVLDWMFV
eukprot:CAMPEP_0185759760 /NCGR_PEP_ID=MMETSP1174-20130828/18543_1 /TAXON_ID=35687 /ORGANISM="Dictyocha speculum, Strain CCMP1381" /LENGTH=139 /DNA_ID=CAMNT_0028440251 /DNA_START=123 /DNA_END=539 /DNA_ORIENTATION=-